MTAPAPLPARRSLGEDGPRRSSDRAEPGSPASAQETAPAERKRGRRLHVYWGIALALLVAVGLTCWLVVVPVIRTRTAVERCHRASEPWQTYLLGREVRALGGGNAAAWRLSAYLRLPRRLAPHREMAVRMLGECGPSATATLARILGDVEKHEGPRPPAPKVPLVPGEEGMLRAAAASALGAAGGPEAVEPLIGALADPEDLVRSYAIDSLEILGDPRAAEPLIAVAKDSSTEKSLRWHAVRSLGKVGGEEAYRYLVGLLKHTDGHLRRSAAKALGHMRDRRAVSQLIEVLGQVSPKRTHSAAWWQAMQVDNRFLLVDVRGVEGAFSPFGGGSMRMYQIDDYAMARWNAADALGKIGDRRAVMPLIAMLDDEDQHAWYWAGLALGELGDERAVPHLLAKLEDRNLSDKPRMVLAEAVGKIGHPSAAPGLRGLLAGGRNSKRSKAWILWSLWKAGDAEVVGRCLRDTEDKDAEVRWAAVRALGLIGSGKALAPVLARLEDDDPDVRGVAARSLGLIGDPSAVDALISAVGDRERIVQFWAIVASGRLGDQRAVPALERALQGTSWPYAALWALQRIEARSQERTRAEQ